MTRELAVFLALAILPAVAAGQSPLGGAVSVHREFENREVSVVRIRMEPHAKTTVHDVTPRVVVYLTDARLCLTFPDGTSRVEEHQAGDVAWVPAMRHLGENLSDRPLEFVAIIPAPGPASARRSPAPGR